MSEVLEKTQTSTLIDEVANKTTPHDFDTLAWRELAFLEMKFAPHEAEALARTRIDLHHMSDLLVSGCSHDLAWQILHGTCFAGEDDFDYASLPVEAEAKAAAVGADSEDDGA